MRVNVYAEEITDRIAIITKQIEQHNFTGLRFYLELPATVNGKQHRGPFMHQPGDDDSAAVTFWGKRDLRGALRKALTLLDAHYDGNGAPSAELPPAVGGEWLGGIYVGKTLDAGEPAHLVLLPGEFEEDKWAKAQAWAAQQNGTLPSRHDLLVLFTNARDQFKAEWYWSSESVAGDPECAWYQDFNYGGQTSDHKDDKLRARAVRRVPI